MNYIIPKIDRQGKQAFPHYFVGKERVVNGEGCVKITLMKRRIWLVLPLILLMGTARAEIELINPTDKLVTFDEIVMLQGRVSPPAEVRIEGVVFRPQPDGVLACGLVLNPGKNLVLVGRDEEEKKLRLLHLVTYPDIEKTYDGKKHWARGQIVYLSSLKIIEGYPDGNFYPANPVTRGEFATWLARVKKLPVPVLTGDVFFDVPKEHWRAPYVKAVVEAGYMPPYSKETFGIDDPISRSEAADLAVKTEGLGIVSKIIPLFQDVPQEELVAAPIYAAKEKGLVIGVSAKMPIYDPDRAITRAEAATLISRFGSAQESIRYLSDFEKGYTNDKFCGLNVAPAIVAFTAAPREIVLNRTTSVKLRAEIASRESFSPISKVKVDLSAIGGVPDAEMFDDGTHGDETAGDRVYSLNISYGPKETGEKIFRAVAVDRLGWEGREETSVLVVE